MTTEQLRSRLDAYLAGRDPAYPLLGPLVDLPGGRDGRLFTLRAGPLDGRPVELVLKLYAPDLRGRAHATREWTALTHLHRAGYAVPRGHFFEPDARLLGSPFVVMERVPGRPFWTVFEAAGPDDQYRLTESFVARLAELHALDPGLLRPDGVPADPDGWIEQELAGLRRDSAASPEVVPTGVVRWLERRSPAVDWERPVILHRDYHPWNVVVAGPGSLSVVDWDWGIGDPRFDLAWTCLLMERSGFDRFSAAVRAEYAARTGRVLDEVGYFEVLVTARWLLNVLTPPARPVEPAARADFQAFLVEPVRRARELLADRTGIAC